MKSNTDQKIERNIVMFENEKDFVAEEVTENVEQTTEETPEKKYTEAEFNDKVNEKVKEIAGRRIARKEAQIRKEYDRKYGRLEDVLKAGTGKENVDEMADTFADFYEKNGIKIDKRPDYTAKDIETLARAEANEVIAAGIDDVADEVDRLSAVGFANMTAREKAYFKALAEYRTAAEQTGELEKLGVTADVYNSKEFKEFASKFNSNIPITDVYNIYEQTKPKKNYKTMGSMKQAPGKGAKDYYTQEEIEKLTEEDLDDPAVWEAVRRSMTGK